MDQWPIPIPYELKRYCLKNFTNKMSISNVEESTCALCNIRIFSGHMTVAPITNLKRNQHLHSHSDILKIISDCDNLSLNEEKMMEIESHDGDSLYYYSSIKT